MTRNSMLTGLLGVVCVFGFSLAPIAPAAATILDYTLSGTGSYELGSDNTGGTFTFTWVGDTTNIFGAPAQDLVVPAASVNLTPYFPEPSNPIYNGTFTSALNELVVSAPATPGGFASILMTTDGGTFGALVELSPTGITLNAPFSVTTPAINTSDAGSFLLVGSLFDLADSQTFELESLTSDLTFSAVVAPPSATPLPSTWLMLLSGFVGLGFFAYRGTKKNSAAFAPA